MKHRWKTAGLVFLMMGVANACCLAINPFLQNGTQAATAKFHGVEWNDEYAAKDVPLTAKVATREVARTSWGGVFEISFEDLISKAPGKREIRPLYFVVTDDAIALLNEEKMDAAIQRIAALKQPPAFEDSEIYGISHGARKFANPQAQTTIKVEKDTCTYLYSHESGHFTKLVWKKGVGLVEYGQGNGAHRDGFRLKRQE